MPGKRHHSRSPLPKGKATKAALTKSASAPNGYELPTYYLGNGISIVAESQSTHFRAVRIVTLLPGEPGLYRDDTTLQEFIFANRITIRPIPDCQSVRAIGPESALESLRTFSRVRMVEFEVTTSVAQNDKKPIPVAKGHEQSGYRERSDKDYVHGRKHKSQRGTEFTRWLDAMEKAHRAANNRLDKNDCQRKLERSAALHNWRVNHPLEGEQLSEAIRLDHTIKSAFWAIVMEVWEKDGKPMKDSKK